MKDEWCLFLRNMVNCLATITFPPDPQPRRSVGDDESAAW